MAVGWQLYVEVMSVANDVSDGCLRCERWYRTMKVIALNDMSDGVEQCERWRQKMKVTASNDVSDGVKRCK